MERVIIDLSAACPRFSQATVRDSFRSLHALPTRTTP
jgi:hypothetical protein